MVLANPARCLRAFLFSTVRIPGFAETTPWEFLANMPYLTSPEYVDYSPGAVVNTVIGSREMELLPGAISFDSPCKRS